MPTEEVLTVSYQQPTFEVNLTPVDVTLQFNAAGAGPIGPPGATGGTGPAGVQGVQGPPGSQGLPGPPGAVGQQGAPGAQGLPGPVGPTGSTGATGPAGATGPQGVAGNPGATGATGATGPAGPQGPPGGASASTTLSATFTMPASAATAVASVANAAAFGTGAVVYIQGLGYLSVTAVNTGSNQLTLQNLGYSTNAAQGTTASSGTALTGSGPQGPPGQQGPPGSTGATGSQGATGPAGGQGPVGPAGGTGPQGAAATISAGTATGLPAGSNPTVSNSGTSSAAVFNFGIPAGNTGAAGPAGATGATGSQGPAGATGATGPQGPAGVGMTWRGAWSATVAYALNDGVQRNGSSYICIQPNTGQDPANQASYWSLVAQQGAVGPTGATGSQGNPGPTGPQGNPGPSTPSANAGNALKVGSDSLLYLAAALLVPTGAVLDFAGSTAPSGFLLCDGSSYATATYPTLQSVIGYTYGGSGANFNVPDCRSRSIIGAGGGVGLSNRVLAATGGEENHTLAVGELPAHDHNPETAHGHPGLTYSQVLTPGTGAAYNLLAIGGSFAYTVPVNSALNLNASVGSGTSHNTMMPFIALNKIIKT